MNTEVYIIGNELEFASLARKFSSSIKAIHISYPETLSFGEKPIVFDFGTLVPQILSGKIKLPPEAVLFYNVPKTTLAQLMYAGLSMSPDKVFGFNGLPNLIEASSMEVSVLKAEHQGALSPIFDSLGVSFEVINDTIGMCSPRVICLLINEAMYTLQEETAVEGDIDTAMRLGTNYPYGPFEWLQAIGMRNVYEVLDAVYRYTAEERYRPASLLKKQYLLHSH